MKWSRSRCPGVQVILYILQFHFQIRYTACGFRRKYRKLDFYKASIAEENELDRLQLPSDFTPSTLRFSTRPRVHSLDSTGQRCYAANLSSRYHRIEFSHDTKTTATRTKKYFIFRSADPDYEMYRKCTNDNHAVEVVQKGLL
jgi:hypothetical protein